MIVRQFLQWLQQAPPAERADATSALARAYLYSDLSPDDLAAAEGAMLMLLDDPSPLVRRALAETFAGSQRAPAAVVHALATDQPDIAAPLLERSPLFVDADLIDLIATSAPEVQTAIARRALLPRSVAAAIAEVGSAEACLVLLENGAAEIAPLSINRMVERFGHLAAIRETLLARDDLPVPTRQLLIAKLSSTLADFVAARQWLAEDRARRIAREACEKATVTVAALAPHLEMAPLVRHLRETGQLTAGLLLRAMLSGNSVLFEEALAELSGMTLARVSAAVHGAGDAAFRALYERAGLPASIYPAFRVAAETLREAGFVSTAGGASRLRRRMIERVLTRCEAETLDELEPIMTLLRRYATEAARDEARSFCADLVAGRAVDVMPVRRLIAA
jgi:uncharacterized protein (DUF2336 family)